jgi:hypothetical protein
MFEMVLALAGVLVGVGWRMEGVDEIAEELVLELMGVEEAFDAEAEVEVEVKDELELAVVEDWTAEEDELVNWTEEEGVVEDVGALDVEVGGEEGVGDETGAEEVNELEGVEVRDEETGSLLLRLPLPLPLPAVVPDEGDGGGVKLPLPTPLPLTPACRAKRIWRARLR